MTLQIVNPSIDNLFSSRFKVIRANTVDVFVFHHRAYLLCVLVQFNDVVFRFHDKSATDQIVSSAYIKIKQQNAHLRTLSFHVNSASMFLHVWPPQPHPH